MRKWYKNFCVLIALLLLPISSTFANPFKPCKSIALENPFKSTKSSSLEMAKDKPQIKDFSSLVVQRLELAKEVGIHKWNNKIRIDDQEKDNAYLDNITKTASKMGVNEDLALAFFVSIVEASRDIHIDQFEQWIVGDIHKHKDCSDVYMLEKKLEDLDSRLLSSLKEIEPLLSSEADKTLLRDYLSQSLKDKGFSRYAIDSIERFID